MLNVKHLIARLLTSLYDISNNHKYKGTLLDDDTEWQKTWNNWLTDDRGGSSDLKDSGR